MSTDSSTGPAGPRRRSAGRRASGTRRRVALGVVASVVVPVVAVAAGLLVRPDGISVVDRGPSEVALDASSVVCPGTGGTTGGTSVGVASLAAAGSDGEVTSTTGGTASDLVVQPGRVSEASTGADASTVAATGDLAPGLLATRSVAAPLAAVPCAPTSADQWFTGVGAAAEHSSVLELVNPDAGPAIADVTVLSGAGEVEVAALRGVAVPAGTTSRFDLSELVPRRGDLALRVQVERGRVGASVLDRDDRLGEGEVTSDWLAPQASPATTNVLLGLTRGDGARRLTVANPAADEVSVTVKVISPRATFSPEGVDPIRVPPGSTSGFDLDTVLADASRRGAVGLLVESSGPVTAALRQVTGTAGTTDLSLVSPVVPVEEPTAVVLPSGRSRLLLSGGAADATTTVVATGADGTQLASLQVDLGAGTADNVALPPGTALVSLDSGGVAVRAAVLVHRPGATVLGLGEPARTLQVPDVQPGLP